jgi:riboflavin synthase
MFTGIVEEVGRIERVTSGSKSSRVRIRGKAVLEGTRAGDSICTAGVCLTVAIMDGNCFEADVMAETLRRTRLGSLAAGSPVNLERAMRLDGRFGGHIVSGHIDGTGIIRSMVREDNAVWLTITPEGPLRRYLVEKGSVAVDGVSLTVASLDHEGFRVSIIPHTGKETTLLQQQVGDTVNLECDLIGKYVEKMLRAGYAEDSCKNDSMYGGYSSLSEQFLTENGF